MLGACLGRTGVVEMFLAICRIPALLIKSPNKIKSIWRQWHEERAKVAVAFMKRKEQIATLGERIAKKKEEICGLKRDIRKVRWQMKEPRKDKTV